MTDTSSNPNLKQWQKIWLVLTVLWVLIVATLSIIQQAPIYSAAGLTTLILLMALPCAIVYVLGLVVQNFLLQEMPVSKKEK